MSIKLTAAMLPLAVGACAQAAILPRADMVAQSATAATISATPAAVPVIYTARPVTDPADWRSSNDGQAPGAEGDQ